MALAVLTFLSMVVFAQGRTKCYADIGCVTNESPYWSLWRMISIFPQSPESIKTRFFLFTINNIDQYQVVSARNLSSIYQSNFNGSRNSVFIIHGYTESGGDEWLVNMCQTILQVEDVNCLCVDWRGGSRAIYFQAMNNVQVVGAEIAYFINTIVDHFNCCLSGIHLIGHSLGAHAAGEAGKRRPGIGRITCLDAARPGFEGQSYEVSVDPSDAKFVVAVHTDTGSVGLGMTTLIGHKDFFPNGGKRMTGCAGSQILDLGDSVNLVGAARDVVCCSHVASYHMFTSSIRNPEGFTGYSASTYSSFQEGAGFPCSGDSCSLMGYYTKSPGDTSSCRVYYLNTGPRSNYERWRYKVTIQSSGAAYTLGSISVTLYNSSDYFTSHKIYSGSVVGGRSFSSLIDGLFPPPIVRLTFSWNNFFPLFSPSLWAESVTVIYGNNGAEYKFCSDGTTRENNPQTLTPCP
ncbi:pancreatic lipase-related protein 2-like [Hyla sarda]|uniref:pancreatic lipase-related protein 2-like n=1 Tax=Hyla sarda TaxID=327740 RepID=UPI0024C3F774|nr:pancreatic lipase-related protein 2-like [Hyla sarda]